MNESYHTRKIRQQLDELCDYLRPARIRPENVGAARLAIKGMIGDLMAVDRMITQPGDSEPEPMPETPQLWQRLLRSLRA